MHNTVAITTLDSDSNIFRHIIPRTVHGSVYAFTISRLMSQNIFKQHSNGDGMATVKKRKVYRREYILSIY